MRAIGGQSDGEFMLWAYVEEFGVGYAWCIQMLRAADRKQEFNDANHYCMLLLGQ